MPSLDASRVGGTRSAAAGSYGPLRLRDIQAAIATIRDHIATGAFDRKTSDAVLYNLVVIGEAAAQISDETRDQAPEIPWTRSFAT